MRLIPIHAKTKGEYAKLASAPLIERPLNRYWMRWVPRRMVAIGEDVAVILDQTDIVIRWERLETTRTVRITYVHRDEKKIVFYLMNRDYEK